MWPERTVEMRGRDTRPFERFMQIRIPRWPELGDVEERLENCLLLVVTTGRSDRHERLAILEHDARRQRISRPLPWPELSGHLGIEPELLATHAHRDARVAENDRATNPAAARRAVEDVARAVDDRDVRGVLVGSAAGEEIGRRVGAGDRLEIGRRRTIRTAGIYVRLPVRP